VRILEAAIAARAKAVDIRKSRVRKTASTAWSTWALARACAAVLSQLRRNAAAGCGGAPHGADFGGRLQNWVTTARKPSDNCPRARAGPHLFQNAHGAAGHGETGFPTRVLSTAFGGLYTYAGPPPPKVPPPGR